MELEQQTVTLQLDIEPGMESGQTVTLYGEGDPHPDGDPGDLNILCRWCRIRCSSGSAQI